MNEQDVVSMAITLAMTAERRVIEIGDDPAGTWVVLLEAALLSANQYERTKEFHEMLETIGKFWEMHNGPLKPSPDEIERSAMRKKRKGA